MTTGCFRGKSCGVLSPNFWFVREHHMNVHPPEEVCVPLCQMLSCLDKRPLKQTETSRLIIGFHVAWFCKCSFHLFSLFKVRQIYRNQGFVLFFTFLHSRSPLANRAWAPWTSRWHIQLIFIFPCHGSMSVSMFFTCLFVVWIHTVFSSVCTHSNLLQRATDTTDVCIHIYRYCRIDWFLKCTYIRTDLNAEWRSIEEKFKGQTSDEMTISAVM